jgi:hypothetical protein
MSLNVDKTEGLDLSDDIVTVCFIPLQRIKSLFTSFDLCNKYRIIYLKVRVLTVENDSSRSCEAVNII